jgi:hypothetical protein
VVPLRLEPVLVGDVGQLDHLAFGGGVLELSLRHLRFLVLLTSILQETLFFSRDAVPSLVTEILRQSSHSSRATHQPVFVGTVEIHFLFLSQDRNRFCGGTLRSRYGCDDQGGKSDLKSFPRQLMEEVTTLRMAFATIWHVFRIKRDLTTVLLQSRRNVFFCEDANELS